MNAGRNTHIHAPLPPASVDRDELGDEASDTERAFVAYCLAAGIRLADWEDE